jgi:cell wall-associated NlpC family hydrolase
MKILFAVSLLLLLTACGSNPPRTQEGGNGGELIPYAKSLIGTPYHYGGESPSTGFDCSGFVRHVYHHTEGIELPRSALAMSRVGTRIKANQMQPGDLVFYSTQGTPYSHVGIFLGNAKFIHAPSTGKKVEIVDMSMHYWQEHYNGARRVSAKTNIR